MLTYVQRTGALYADDGELIAVGYSGQPGWKNDPAADGERNKGPIPRGEYLIGPPRSTLAHGPYVLSLTPDGANEMHGRGNFLIHGDKVGAPGTASQGCIVLAKEARVTVWERGDRLVRVVAEREDVCRTV